MDEHEAFKYATDGIGQAVEGVKQIARHRRDQRDVWLQVAQTLAITRESIFRLAGEGKPRSKNQ